MRLHVIGLALAGCLALAAAGLASADPVECDGFTQLPVTHAVNCVVGCIAHTVNDIQTGVPLAVPECVFTP